MIIQETDGPLHVAQCFVPQLRSWMGRVLQGGGHEQGGLKECSVLEEPLYPLRSTEVKLHTLLYGIYGISGQTEVWLGC